VARPACAIVVFCLLVVTLRAAPNPQSPAKKRPASPVQAALPPGDAAPAPEPARKITQYTLPPDLYAKARTLGTIRFAFRLFSFFYALFALWLILRTKLSVKFRDWAESVSRVRFLQALIYTPLLALAFGLLSLPLDLFSEWLMKAYGISVQPWSSWTADWLKAELLIMLVGSLFAWILFAMIRRSPQRWWFYFWTISVPISVFLFFLQPVIIDPLFSKFEPLSAKAPALIPQLERITLRGGMPIAPNRMFWMLASDKTIYTNAYVTGIGATKRVVIWDTSLAKETTDGVLTMFGHEMGHYALHHIWKGLAFLSAMVFVLLFLGYRFTGRLLGRYGVLWGIRGAGDWAALPAFLLLVTLFGSVANILLNAYSRYQENQADIYSLEVTHGIVPDPGQACALSFQKFGEDALIDPHPNPVHVMLFFDHPTVADRIHLCATYDPWSAGQTPEFVR
jgi:STE24 endopeptidase